MTVTRVALGEVLEEVDIRAGSDHATLPVLSLTKDRGLVPQTERFKQRIARVDVDEYKVIRRGQLAVNPYVLWEGAVAALTTHDAGLISPVYPVWQPKPAVEPDYLNYLLKSAPLLGEYERLAAGAVKRRRTISAKTFSEIEVCIPPQDEQRRVVDVLTSIERSMMAGESVSTWLRGVQQALAGKLFGNSEWSASTLGNETIISSGGTPSRSRTEYWNGHIPWVKTGEVRYGNIARTEESITEAGLAESSAKLYPAGTVLMAMYGEGATRGRVAKLGIEAAINQACAAFSVGARLDPGFLYHYLAFSYAAVRALSHGSHQKNLSASLLRSFPIPLPDINTQRQVAHEMDKIEARAHAESVEADWTRQVHQSLLAECFVDCLGAVNR